MSKFDNPVVEVGGKSFPLRLDNFALARIEDIYDTGFAKAVAALATEISDQSIRIDKLARLFCAVVYVEDETDRPTYEWAMKNIALGPTMTAVVSAIGRALNNAIPENEGDAAADDAPENPTTMDPNPSE